MTPEDDQYMLLAQSKAYYLGLREGLKMYAHWKDGVQYVGTTGKTLKEAIQEINNTEAQVLAKFSTLKTITYGSC